MRNKGYSPEELIHRIDELEKENRFLRQKLDQEAIEIKKVEKNLRDSEEKFNCLDTNKNKFMQIMAHDMRSPFSGLIGLSNILMENIDEFDKAKILDMLEMIRQIQTDTLNLLDDMLLWSKSLSGSLPFHPERLVFHEICRKVLIQQKTSASSKNIHLHCADSEKVILTADPNMLKTILRNLISNAIKFTDVNGRIEISAQKKNDHIVITVSDTGIGIDQPNQDKLWKETNNSNKGTRGENGTGLGLSLCKEFVERHKGQIWVESEPGKGTKFSFTIPFLPDDMLNSPASRHESIKR